MPRLSLQILIPPLLPELLINLPLLFLLLSLLSSLIHSIKPFLSRGVLFFLRGVFDHAVVHGFLLCAAEEGRSEGAVCAACGEV